MKSKLTVAVVAGCVVIALAWVAFLWVRQGRGNVKAEAVGALSRVAVALAAGDKDALLDGVAVPVSLRGRGADEQYRFITAALDGEVSGEGLRILAKAGTFGSLTEIFPDEGVRWAAIAGVDPAACVAFKLERNGFVAEAAVATNGIHKTIRLNNVRRLTDEPL